MNTDWITCEDCWDVDGDVIACDTHRQARHVETGFYELSMTKAIERLRRAAKLVRDTRGYPANWRTEVGTRCLPVYAEDEETARRLCSITMGKGGHDDLDACGGIESVAHYDHQVRGNGYVCHLYFSSNGDYGELEDVVTVWTGTATAEPVIIH
jgi:hypothetical protein